MSTYLRNTLVFLVACCCWSSVLCGETKPVNPIGPDPTIQARLDRLIRASLTGNDIDLQKKKLAQGLKELRKSVGNGGAELAPQIVFLEFAAENEQLMYTAEYLLLELVSDLTTSQIATAIAPYLRSKDRSVRVRLFELMDYHVCNGRPMTDYSPIFNMMRVNKGKLPDETIEYMFERSPGKALLGYMGYHNAPDRKAILLAEHEISDTLWKHQYALLGLHEVEPAAMKQLEMLSRHKAWWARMYVANIMREHRAFRQPQIIERLKQDEHPLVRRTMSFVKTEDEKK